MKLIPASMASSTSAEGVGFVQRSEELAERAGAEADRRNLEVRPAELAIEHCLLPLR